VFPQCGKQSVSKEQRIKCFAQCVFHGMALLCHIEGSMITAVWTHLRMFQNTKFYNFMFINVEFCLSRCLGAWTVVCTWQFRPWTGSIKLSLQHFQFWRIGLLLGILIFSILTFASTVFVKYGKQSIYQTWLARYFLSAADKGFPKCVEQKLSLVRRAICFQIVASKIFSNCVEQSVFRCVEQIISFLSAVSVWRAKYFLIATSKVLHKYGEHGIFLVRQTLVFPKTCMLNNNFSNIWTQCVFIIY
jgi:hypothetical protein